MARRASLALIDEEFRGYTRKYSMQEILCQYITLWYHSNDVLSLLRERSVLWSLARRHPSGERFLSAQADPFAGSERERKIRPAPFGMTVTPGSAGASVAARATTWHLRIGAVVTFIGLFLAVPVALVAAFTGAGTRVPTSGSCSAESR